MSAKTRTTAARTARLATPLAAIVLSSTLGVAPAAADEAPVTSETSAETAPATNPDSVSETNPEGTADTEGTEPTADREAAPVSPAVQAERAAVLERQLLAVQPKWATERRVGPKKQFQRDYKRPNKAAKVLSVMRAQLGDPYVYGAAGPNAFDCSGLVYYSARKAGIGSIPRTADAQSRWMRRINRASIKVGDFVFMSNGSRVYHVGVYVGGNRILHSPRPGQRVQIDPIWTSNWFAGTLRGR